MVSWLLEGSVRKSGDMVRIAVQLVRAADGFSAWSGRFDRQLDDIFTVQDDIAGMIAQTLTQRVAKASAPLVTSTTSKTEAYCCTSKDAICGTSARATSCGRRSIGSNGPWPSIPRSLRPAALAGVYTGASGSPAFFRRQALANQGVTARAAGLDPQLAAGHTAVGYATLHFDGTRRACQGWTRQSR